MKTVQIITPGGKVGVAAVAHIELAFIVTEGNSVKLNFQLSSGDQVSSFAFESREAARKVLDELFE